MHLCPLWSAGCPRPASTTTPKDPWFSWQYVVHNIDSLTTALHQHVELTLSTVGIAALIGIPLAVAAYRLRWLTGPILAVIGHPLHDPVAGAVRPARAAGSG